MNTEDWQAFVYPRATSEAARQLVVVLLDFFPTPPARSHGEPLQMLPVMMQTAHTIMQNGKAELAEISKNYFPITSLIASVSSQSFHTIRRTSHGAPGFTALYLTHTKRENNLD